MEYLLVCPPGLEDIVLTEIKSKVKFENIVLRYQGILGRIFITTKDEKDLFQLQTINRITKILLSFNAQGKTIKDILKQFESLNLKKYLMTKDFRITNKVVGRKDLDPQELQDILILNTKKNMV